MVGLLENMSLEAWIWTVGELRESGCSKTVQYFGRCYSLLTNKRSK